MSKLKIAAQLGSVVSVGALTIMVAFTAPREGLSLTTYVDRLGKGTPLTYCYGSTEGAVAGRTYTRAECLAALERDALKHAAGVQRCLPPGLPDKTAAAFYDLGYNIGTEGFCRSSIARRAQAGDLRGACDRITLYVYSAGKDCRVRANGCFGIVKRREDERSLCLKGLTP